MLLSIICGGQSTEHEISVASAKNIAAALNPRKYDITIIYITQDGRWYLTNDSKAFFKKTFKALLEADQIEPITLVLGENKQPWQSLNNPQKRYGSDCIFPMLHGTFGEDGTLQGLLELMKLPYVGSGPQSSAICIEKDITKQLLKSAGLPTLEWHTIRSGDVWKGLYPKLTDRFGKELFIKPVSLGSSVGTTPVKTEDEFQVAVKKAFNYDDRVMVEPRVRGREIECSVLGNGNPKASLPGEIVTRHEFYSYDAKYKDPQGASTEAPAKLPSGLTKKIQAMAVSAFKTLYCSGMARVDFFLLDENIFINEVNTIPGFTNISMYPTMWEASGLPYDKLLDQLINLAMDRYRYQQSLTRVYHH